MKIEACKSTPSFQELYPQAVQSTSKWESRQERAQSILIHAKHTIMTKKLFDFHVKFHGYMNSFTRYDIFNKYLEGMETEYGQFFLLSSSNFNILDAVL